MTYPVMEVGVKEAGGRLGLLTAVHPREAWGVSLEAGSLRREDMFGVRTWGAHPVTCLGARLESQGRRAWMRPPGHEFCCLGGRLAPARTAAILWVCSALGSGVGVCMASGT